MEIVWQEKRKEQGNEKKEGKNFFRQTKMKKIPPRMTENKQQQPNGDRKYENKVTFFITTASELTSESESKSATVSAFHIRIIIISSNTIIIHHDEVSAQKEMSSGDNDTLI